MSHETFLTTKDKLESAIGASDEGVTIARKISVPWIVVAAGLGAAAVMTSGAISLGLAAGAAYSGYEAAETLITETFFNRKKPAHKHEQRDEAAPPLPPQLANNLDPVPQLADDLPNQQWRKHVTDKVSRYALNRNERGF